jgi:hypothetical protein
MDSTPSPLTSRDEVGISPGTQVYFSVRTLVSFVVAIVVIVFGAGGGYWALASTDKTHDGKLQALEAKTADFATKADLKNLRMQVRMDLLSSVWSCTPVQGGGMQCHPRLPRGYDEAN